MNYIIGCEDSQGEILILLKIFHSVTPRTCLPSGKVGPYAIDKGTDSMLATKIETFRALSKTQKAIHLTFVTSCGLVRNSYWNMVQSEVTLDDLFRE